MKVCVFRSLVSLVFLASPALATDSPRFVPSNECTECRPVLNKIESDLDRVLSRMNALSDDISKGTEVKPPEPQPLPTTPATPVVPPVSTGPAKPKSVFIKRLDAKKTFEAGQERLTKIEKDLADLENEIKHDQSVLPASPTPEQVANLDRLRRLASTQRLIVEEIKNQLADVQRRFEELDAMVDAHEEKIDAFRGGIEKLSEEMKKVAPNVSAHRVTSEWKTYDGMKEFAHAKTGSAPPLMFSFPRTEARIVESDTSRVEITTSVGGKIFGIVSGEAAAGLVFDTQLTTETYLYSPGTDTLLTENGALTRDAYMFCAASRNYTFRGFGSGKAEAGIDAVIFKSTTSAKWERGATETADSHRYSQVVLTRQGQTFEQNQAICRAFTAEVRRTSNFAGEVSGMVKNVQIPESVCYKDYDCRNDVSLGMLYGSTISQCFATPGRDKAVCQHRYVDTPQGHCSLPTERLNNFKYQCAKGYTCGAKSRLCVKDESSAKLLADAGVADAKVVKLSASVEEVGVGDKFLGGENYCNTLGRLSANEGWRLPTQAELKKVGEWFKDYARETLRKKYPKSHAQQWYYPAQANTGYVFSQDLAVYLLSSDSVTTFNPNDAKSRESFEDPKTKQLPKGTVVCVKPKK